ncbi:hypothetical protein ACIBEF_32090 [Micromonospora sp. NPDC050795]|uniref:hypothetical protein n=1 Tax=Micromonospora sp. NPDC050795 TaxID=3364282 RepID=UPI0037B544B6
MDLRYVQPNGNVLAAEESDRIFREGARTDLRMIDRNVANFGYVSTDGTTYSKQALSNLPSDKHPGLTEKILDAHKEYVTYNGRIRSAAEISFKDDLAGGVTKLDYLAPDHRGFVSEKHGTLYSHEQGKSLLNSMPASAWEHEGDKLAQVDTRRIQQGYVAPDGRAFTKDEAMKMMPEEREKYRSVDLGAVKIGFIAQNGVVHTEAGKDRFAVDLGKREVFYMNPDAHKISAKQFVGMSPGDRQGFAPFDRMQFTLNVQQQARLGAMTTSVERQWGPGVQRPGPTSYQPSTNSQNNVHAMRR